MRLNIRILSGSRAGEELSFDSDTISIGRNQACDIAFDPEQDLLVSSTHAQIVARGATWVVRDLGSANGTYFDGEKVTERVIRSGQEFQLGKTGPRLRLSYDAPSMPSSAPGTEPGAPPVPEGRTVAMMVQDGGGRGSGIEAPAPPSSKPAKKKSKAAVVVLTLLVVFVFLAAAFVGAVLLARSKSREARVAAVQAAQIEETQKVKEATEIKKQLRDQQEAVQEVQQKIETVVQQGGTPSKTEVTDLQRQLEESQRMIEELARQLQQKNDEVAAARAAADRAAKNRVVVAPKFAPPPPPPPPTATAAPPPVTSAAQSTAPASPSLPANLDSTPKLKKKVVVSGLPPEVPPADLPSDTPRQLADLIGRSLAATGRYVIDTKGIATVDSTVTNYLFDQRTNANLKSASDAASRIGSLAGKNIPTTPVNVTSFTYTAALGARVRVFDRVGNELNAFELASQSKDTKSKVSLEPIGLKFAQAFGSDTPLGDVSRDVVGKAVESAESQLSSIDWTGLVTSQKDNKLIIDAGRRHGVELDDWFEVLDGTNVVAVARVTEVVDSTCTAEIQGAAPKTQAQGKLVRYAGTPRQGAAARLHPPKSLRMTKDSPAFSGPGNSFSQVKPLKKGAKLAFSFSVGIWARASDGSTSFWVPLTAAQIE